MLVESKFISTQWVDGLTLNQIAELLDLASNFKSRFTIPHQYASAQAGWEVLTLPTIAETGEKLMYD